MKKRVVGIILGAIVLLTSACSILEQPPEKVDVPIIEPIVAQVWSGERTDGYELSIDALTDIERLEEYFKFYADFDESSMRLSLVKDGKWYRFDVQNNELINLHDSTSWGKAAVDGNSISVESSVVLAGLGYQVSKSETLTLMTADEPDSIRVTVSGEAYSDHTKTQKVTLENESGIWLDQEESFSLVLTDHKGLLWVGESGLEFAVEEEVLEEEQQLKPLLIAWDLYGNKSEQEYHESLDVIIPKWLSLKAEDGTINDLYRPLYHENIKKQGKDLWVLVNNSFDPELTSSVLNSLEARENMIGQLIDYALINKVEGINIDFENMFLEDSDLFVQFVAELSTRMKEKGLILSVAVTVPGGSDNWSIVYDRDRLSEVSDYLTLMAYDQYWASSQTSGPVAGYSWVDGHLEELVKTIPSEKILLGVPFYTRIWYETPSLEIPNQMKVKSKSVYMASPQQLIDDYDPVRVWDATNSQYYFAYFKDNQLIKFWYDDEEAVGRKAQLIHKYNLAGIAAWSLGFERETVWPVLQKVKEDIQ
ncbi:MULTISPECIES: glycosyl hydrolase family 18 protein [unclassified Fusibacter]|uniref:glycosyl hydrolase family 18 protein n=1 Tax=unclassified Fusibacter TaxID=2624464 RepID=UPI0013E96AF0|nr:MULTISPECIES: glycosyl hydrolase family 18 protein [unclassified Fusibacter]MCK8061551.1 glycosyl hydrolase family 18 protein [Fusibacter sp. A2]NPE23721.1 hypothetical protein [Fusibacter sp. A1]